DAKSLQRRHDYVTVVSDLEGSRVLLRRRLCPTGVTLSIGGGPDGGQARAAGGISLARARCSPRSSGMRDNSISAASARATARFVTRGRLVDRSPESAVDDDRA